MTSNPKFNLLYSYFNNIDRVVSFSHVPTNQDILQLHIQSTGITNKNLAVGEFVYEIYDIKDRRSERQRWTRYFVDTDVIIFVVDISAYDRCLYEDDACNGMQEVFSHFDFTCNSPGFFKTSMVLLFTKVDLLQRKLAISSFDKYFVDFSGDTLSLEAVKAYFATRFVSLNRQPNKIIQVCFTDMTDDESLGKSAFAALETCMRLKEGWI